MATNAQAGGSGAVVGLLVGLAFGGAIGPSGVESPGVEPQTNAGPGVDQLDTIEVTVQDGVPHAVIEKKAGDKRTSVTPYSAQYVSNAIEACDEYEATRGFKTERCGRWDAMRSKLVAAGHALPVAD